MNADNALNPICASEANRGAAIRAAVLFVLLFAAFRKNAGEIMQVGIEFSEWSHMFAIPVVVAAFLYCRLSEAGDGSRTPSAWGFLIVCVGILMWCGIVSLGMFGYLQIIAFWICACGIVALTAGRRVFRICIPLMLMMLTCLPVFERTMDRFTIPIQGVSIRAAAKIANGLSGDDIRADGRNIARRGDGRAIIVGTGEQRFGLRMMQSCSLLMLFIAFYRKRPVLHLTVLALAFLPVLLGVNVFRLVVWLNMAWWRGNELADSVPRNVSAAAALIAAFLAFVMLAGLLQSGSRLARMFYVDDADGEASSTSESDDEPIRESEARPQ